MSHLSGEVPFDFDCPVLTYEDMDSYEAYDPTYYGAIFEPAKYEPLECNTGFDTTASSDFAFDPALLELPSSIGHGRSTSYSSTYSAMSSVESSPASVCSRISTPSPSPALTATYSPPVRQHGPILLPKIRPQDQAVDTFTPAPPAKRLKRATTPAPRRTPIARATSKATSKPKAKTHFRSLTNPESVSYTRISFTAGQTEDLVLTASPIPVSQDGSNYHHTRSSSVDAGVTPTSNNGGGGSFTFAQVPAYVPATPSAPAEAFMFPSCYTKGPAAPIPRSSPILGMAVVPEPQVPQTNLASYLTSSNPAPSLVRSISYPLRDPHTKHFWWDVRQLRSWNTFTAATILSLPGAANLLSCPIPAPALLTPAPVNRHPENEASLHRIYAAHYLPKLNAALALSSARPLQLLVPAKSAAGTPDNLFIATAAGEPATAATIFGGKPSAHVVGLVRSYDRFNTGMRTESNIGRVEYLRGLAALHHAMREHGCRYGFMLTEIELIIVRNGVESRPHFGHLEVTSVQLKTAAPEGQFPTQVPDLDQIPLTACLALWGLCMMAGDEAAPGQAHWRSDIGAPAEGSRRKALERDSWMPQPQLAEKREAKRSRGWVIPEDAVGRKEIGKRGVKYGGC